MPFEPPHEQDNHGNNARTKHHCSLLRPGQSEGNQVRKHSHVQSPPQQQQQQQQQQLAKVLVQETRAWDGKGAKAACRVGANQDGFLHGMPCDSHDGVVVPAGHPSGLGGRRPQNLHETIRGVVVATFKWGGLRPEPAASSNSRER
jgi:hypothetical protein